MQNGPVGAGQSIEAVFVAGKPLTDIWAEAGLAWHARLQESISGPIRHPRLAFVRNDRNHFDLDNLAYPVLSVIGCATCEAVWATVGPGPTEGVWISDASPPPPPVTPGVMRVHIATPPNSSVADRLPLPELSGVDPIGGDGPVGLALQFDAPDTPVGQMSYDGPTKSLIDDLGPLLGFRPYRGRMVSADDRVKELRVSRGHHRDRFGVTVTVWLLS